MPWPIIAAVVASFVAAYVFTPRPSAGDPPTAGEFEAPTAEEGREITVIFGTRDIEDMNVVWYGDLSTEPVKKSGGKK